MADFIFPEGFDRLLVSDYDGTVTAVDFYQQVLERYSTDRGHEAWDQFLAGELTHFEALQTIFSELPADEQAVMGVARSARIDPEMSTAIEQLAQAGWGVIVVSAGCLWYVERVLAEQDIQVPVIAIPGELTASEGLRMHLPTDSPFCHPETGVDKEKIVREALQRYADVAFAGDGRPDIAAARLVRPQRRFARGWLAQSLEREGLPYRPFDRWGEIASGLLTD